MTEQPTDSRTLTQLARTLHRRRQDLHGYELPYAEAVSKLDATPEARKVAAIEDNIRQVKQDVSDLEKAIKNKLLTQFEETGDKSPLEGLGIREYTVLEYEDRQARDWAIANPDRRELLTVDKRKFKKVAKALDEAGMGLDFVTVKKDPRPTISKDLSHLDDELSGNDSEEVPF